MPLPYLQSYNDPRIQKAYVRYLDGQSQRKIAAALKIPQRTLARYCKNDGWEAERQSRSVTEEAPTVAAVAAGNAEVATGAAKPQSKASGEAPTESRATRMESMLARQQRIVGKLVSAYEKDVEKTLSDAEASGKQLQRAQIAQLALLGNNLMAMERKAWCVPDKIETKDTTPTPVDPIRSQTDDQLERRKRDLEQQLAAADGRAGSDSAGTTPAQSVN